MRVKDGLSTFTPAPLLLTSNCDQHMLTHWLFTRACAASTGDIPFLL